jgi:uncharacterized protein (UPF0276 family)
MLLENPSTYIAFENSTMSEVEFLLAIVRRTGCGLLLDVNNAYVSAVNHDFEPMAYLDAFPVDHVGEVHLAGFAEDRDDLDAPLLIDAHGTPVSDVVWLLYRRALARVGPRPTLIEWDNDVPPFAVLASEAARAKTEMADEIRRRERHAHELRYRDLQAKFEPRHSGRFHVHGCAG